MYYQEKTKAGFRKENILQSMAEWWANGNMIDNEKVGRWGGREGAASVLVWGRVVRVCVYTDHRQTTP